MDPANELIILVGREDVGDFNRIGELMDAIYRKEVQEGKDTEALEAGKKYRRKMQKLFDEQEQRQS